MAYHLSGRGEDGGMRVQQVQALMALREPTDVDVRGGRDEKVWEGGSTRRRGDGQRQRRCEVVRFNPFGSP